MSKQKGQLTSLQKLVDSGHEAVVDETLVDDTAIPDKTPYVITLSENGADALLDLATIGVLEYQRDAWERLIMDNQTIPAEITADIGAQEALYEVLNMAGFRFALVIVDVNHTTDFLADWYNANFNGTVSYRPGYLYFSVWTTVGEAKAKNYWHQTDEFTYKYYGGVDPTNSDTIPWADNDPCLILATNKFIKWGFVDYRDTPIPANEPELEMLTRIQLSGTEHYFAEDPQGWPNDAIAKLKLDLNKIVSSNTFRLSINQNIATLILNYLFLNIQNLPASAPPGGWPPGFTPPTPGQPDPPLSSGAWVDLNCKDYIFLGRVGTSDVVFWADWPNAAIFPIPTLPIPFLYLNGSIKSLIDGMLTTAGVTDLTQVDTVKLCFEYASTEIVKFDFAFIGVGMLQWVAPYLEIASGPGGSTTSNIDLKPDTHWTVPVFHAGVNIAGVPVSVGIEATVAAAVDDPFVYVHDYASLSDINVRGRLLPAFFDNGKTPLDSSSGTPIFRMGLAGYQLKAASWRGVQLLGDIEQPCTVVEHHPGFFQDAYVANIDFGSGDTINLFSGGWRPEIVAVLWECYIPAAPAGMWWPDSGSSGQGVFDAWIAANPQLVHDTVNHIYPLFTEETQVNRICYHWMKPPAGTVQFGFDQSPNPASCWWRIVAYKTTDGVIHTQDAAHKCSSITYPAYPACPF